jgi:hypothetical protein
LLDENWSDVAQTIAAPPTHHVDDEMPLVSQPEIATVSGGNLFFAKITNVRFSEQLEELQGLEKEQIERRSFKTSGRKATSTKPNREISDLPQADVMPEPQPIPVPTAPIEPRLASTPSPITPPANAVRPRIFTMVRDQVDKENLLKPVLMSYVKGVDVAELKRALGQVEGGWRAIKVPDDCRAALEWVDAQ